ncbi:hypothetical protein JZ751_018848 [Albula glossodonta]|uniref:Rhophilin-1 n=1 Tax=Albula glossodonta TaxID=121402 RepID=A0A8T2N0Y7_9TELE|nr:hypothetical protein JZ751_018848 [Albula glossodonta]
MEMMSDVGSDEEQASPMAIEEDSRSSGSIRKGCDPLSQTQRSKLQHRRARINQQINKEMRMRAGAENLFRATTNHKVKETVALELSFVNSNLQLLKEELEELNSNMEAYQTESESVNVPMIPLGLKETKEVDLSVPLKDFICEHYGEDGSLYENEIKEFMELRQAMRTPSRNEAGLELLMEFYNQLYFLDHRFFPPNKTLGVHFHWYDSLTGVPSCQRALAFEKGSVLFNIGALYTQIGARQDRSSVSGIDCAIDAFQKAAGAFNYLKENFSNAPSLDMSGASLCMLVRLMVAQVQECVFERVLLLQDASFTSHLQGAQEAARVKAEHFRALSHYYAAVALCDHAQFTEEDDDMDILQEVLSFTHKRSLDKYSDIDREDDFFEMAEAPDIHLRVTDIFHRLGPLSVFSAKNRWGPQRQVRLVRGEGGLGLTLRGDSPVLIAGVVPGGCAAEAGLREGDYIVAVNGTDCKWAKHAEVVQTLKACSDRGVDLSIITLLTPEAQTQKTGGGGVTKRPGSTFSNFSLPFGNLRDTEAMY